MAQSWLNEYWVEVVSYREMGGKRISCHHQHHYGHPTVVCLQYYIMTLRQGKEYDWQTQVRSVPGNESERGLLFTSTSRRSMNCLLELTVRRISHIQFYLHDFVPDSAELYENAALHGVAIQELASLWCIHTCVSRCVVMKRYCSRAHFCAHGSVILFPWLFSIGKRCTASYRIPLLMLWIGFKILFAVTYKNNFLLPSPSVKYNIAIRHLPWTLDTAPAHTTKAMLHCYIIILRCATFWVLLWVADRLKCTEAEPKCL